MKKLDAGSGAVLDLLASLNPIAKQLVEDDHTDLFEFGALDSVLILEFVAALEERFSFTFDLRDLTSDHFRDLHSLASLLRTKYKAAL